MTTNNQRDTASAVVGGAVPGTTLPSELIRVEPTKVDEATQQGIVTYSLFPHPARDPHSIVAFDRREGCI